MAPRRFLLTTLGTVVILLAAVLAASPSSAASTAGKLLIKGPGSVYSSSNANVPPYAYVSENVGAGSTDQFELQVRNTGETLAQFNIKLYNFGPLAATADLYAGTVLLSPLAQGPDGYFTAPIQPGKTQALTLKVKIPAGSPQGTEIVGITLNSTDGTYITGAYAQTDVKAPTYGTTDHDVFAKQGAQNFVGGSLNGQVSTSPAVAYNGTGAFSVKLQNDGATPAAVLGHLNGAVPHCATIVVKDGSTDVTAALQAGTYTTPVLAVHASRTLAVTVKRTAASCPFPFDTWRFEASHVANGAKQFVDIVVPYPEF